MPGFLKTMCCKTVKLTVQLVNSAPHLLPTQLLYKLTAKEVKMLQPWTLVQNHWVLWPNISYFKQCKWGLKRHFPPHLWFAVAVKALMLLQTCMSDFWCNSSTNKFNIWGTTSHQEPYVQTDNKPMKIFLAFPYHWLLIINIQQTHLYRFTPIHHKKIK